MRGFDSACNYYPRKPQSYTPCATGIWSAVEEQCCSGRWYSELRWHAFARPTLLVGTYLATTALFDVVRIRTLWLKFGTVDISIVFTISLAAKIGVLTTEALKKRRHLVQNEKDASSEETSGLFNLAFFLWPLGLIKTGFKKVLLGDDLPTIDRGLAPGKAQQRFLAIWNSSKCRSSWLPEVMLMSVYPADHDWSR